MREESEMEESEMEESVTEEKSESEDGDKKEYSEDEMIECLMNDCSSLDECKDKMEEYGYELVKKDEEKSSDFESIEKELGMKRSMPKVSVIRLSAARNALGKEGKRS